MVKLNFKLVALAITLCVQFFSCDVIAQESRHSKYKASWNDGPVDLNLFLGGKPRVDTLAAVISYSLESNFTKQEIDGVKYRYNKCEAYIDYEFSKYNPQTPNLDNVQRYAQTIMNINEKYARMCTFDLADNNDDLPSDIVNYYYNRLTNACDDFKEVCEDGKDSTQVYRYFEKSVSDLEGTYFDPVAYTASLKETRGMGANLGLCYNSPSSEYFGKEVGFDLAFDYFFKPSFFLGLGWQLGFGGKCGKDFKCDDGRMVDYGETMHNGNIMLRIGARAINGNGIKLYPFVGLGTSFYYDRLSNSRDEKPRELYSFAYSVGVNVDFVVNRNVYLYDRDWFHQQRTYDAVRIAPSVSFANYKGIGKVTMLNVAVSYAQVVTRLKKR